MRQLIEGFIKQREELETQLKEWVKDKSVPLKERWETFVLSDMGEHKVWRQHFDSLPEDFIMYEGDYHAERYETIEMKRVVDKIERSGTKYHDVDLDAFKEEILEKFLKSFKYDW